jgi:hypothetical protein
LNKREENKVKKRVNRSPKNLELPDDWEKGLISFKMPPSVYQKPWEAAGVVQGSR